MYPPPPGQQVKVVQGLTISFSYLALSLLPFCPRRTPFQELISPTQHGLPHPLGRRRNWSYVCFGKEVGGKRRDPGGRPPGNLVASRLRDERHGPRPDVGRGGRQGDGTAAQRYGRDPGAGYVAITSRRMV